MLQTGLVQNHIKSQFIAFIIRICCSELKSYHKLACCSTKACIESIHDVYHIVGYCGVTKAIIQKYAEDICQFTQDQTNQVEVNLFLIILFMFDTHLSW